jgi:hypothetical protein
VDFGGAAIGVVRPAAVGLYRLVGAGHGGGRGGVCGRGRYHRGARRERRLVRRVRIFQTGSVGALDMVDGVGEGRFVLVSNTCSTHSPTK